jgi:hypothetical protein
MQRPHILLSLILLAAAALRLWQLDVTPPGFHLDESFEGLEAWRILTDPTYRPLYLAGNFGVPPVNAYANAVTFALFGWFGGEAGPLAMRSTAAVVGLLGVLAVWLVAGEVRRLAPEQFSPHFPLWAAGTLAAMRWHIHFSRMGIEPIFVPLLWAASIWLFLRGRRTGNWLNHAASGLLLALCIYTYHGAWIIPPLMAPLVIHLWFERASHPLRFSGVLVTAGVAMLAVAPLAVFFVQNPDLLFLRPTQLAVTGAVESAGRLGPWQSLLAYLHMFLPIGVAGDLDPRRNLPGEAALNWFLALPFWLGVGLALRHSRRVAFATLLAGWLGLLLPGIFSEYAPHFHRVLGAAAPVALLAGMGLDQLAGWLAALFNRQRIGRRAPTALAGLALPALLLLAGAGVSAWDYFGRWARLPDLFYAFDAGLWEIGQDLAAAPAGEPLYLTPRSMAHPTLAFAPAVRAPAKPWPVTFDGRHIFPLQAGATANAETYIAIDEEDFRTRLLIRDLFPAVEVVKEVKDRNGSTYATYFRRAAGLVDERPPFVALPVELGDGLALAGFDAQPAIVFAGDTLYVQLHWRVRQAPAEDWTVFVHLVDGQEEGGDILLAGFDSLPGAGSLPTVRWQPGWRVLDEYQLALPPELAPGLYRLQMGLYRPDGGQLPTSGPVTLGGIEIQARP